jgi:hypothetical protein
MRPNAFSTALSDGTNPYDRRRKSVQDFSGTRDDANGGTINCLPDDLSDAGGYKRVGLLVRQRPEWLAVVRAAQEPTVLSRQAPDGIVITCSPPSSALAVDRAVRFVSG